VSALVLAFTFTNLPKLIKKHKLIILPSATYGALVLLLGVCAIYTKGNWFIIPAIAILFACIIIFAPIFIAKYKIFEKIKKYNDFVSVAVDFVFLNIFLLIIDNYCIVHGYSENHWYLKFALPIAFTCYVLLSIIMCVRFIKANKLIKTSLILYFINLLYLFVPFIKVEKQNLKREISDWNIFNADLSKWKVEGVLEPNINLIIFLTLLGVATAFLMFGLLKYLRNKKVINKNNK
jgi:hypothetical protein